MTAQHRDPRRAWAAWAVLAIYLLALLYSLSSCSVQDRAARKVRWAQVHAPELFTQDSVRITLPADSAAGSTALQPVDLDSLVAACNELSEALSAERELYAVVGGLWMKQQALRNREVDSLRNVLRMRPGTRRTSLAVEALRTRLCNVQPIHLRTARYSLAMWMEGDSLRYRLELFPQLVTAPRTVINANEKPLHVYRWWFIGAMALLALLGFIWRQGNDR